jgi:tetrahydromethanopterin S-methyltransferase subunit E
MRIGAALVLLAVGAILRFAITTTATHGIELSVVGDILMIVGLIGLVVWLIVWAPWPRGRRSSYAPRTPLEEDEAAERIAARRGDDPYRRY